MTQIRLKRGTRSQIDAAAGFDGLIVGEPYYVTDENRIVIGTAVDAYGECLMDGDSGDGIGSVDVTLSDGTQSNISAGVDAPMRINPNAVTNDFTLANGYNGVSAGPITINDGVTVAITTHSRWSIV